MCLVLLAKNVFRGRPLVLSANRDEVFARPTQAAHWWTPDGVFGGRDLEKGGTWLAVAADLRLAVVTHVRDATRPVASGLSSRGELPLLALTGQPIDDASFPPYNLVSGDAHALKYARDGVAPSAIPDGIHALSNHRLGTAWPKTMRSQRALAELGTVTPDALFAILADDTPAPDDELPHTGVSIEVERLLSPPFVRAPGYGTRCSTVVMSEGTGLYFEERTFDESGQVTSLVIERMTGR